MTRAPFQYIAGKGKARVVVYADARRKNALYLRWRDRTKGNWARESLGRVVETDLRGKITADCEAFAIGEAQRKSLELASGVAAPKAGAERAPATIGQAEALITNPDTGKYAHKTPFRDELVRALRLAVALWGAETLWTSIDDSHWTLLLRRRLEGLIAGGFSATRATEITIGRLITTVRWLRKKKLIPRDAASWPDDWKDDVVQHWMGVTQSDRKPEPFRPRHTLEEAIGILKATDFDPRFQLLMWLGMELRLGQVARTRRTDLELPPVDWDAVIDPDKTDPTDYGTLEVVGAGKKGGTIVDLTRGQRRMVDLALSPNGYLGPIEQRFQADTVANYKVFPSGYVVGRVALMRERESTVSLSAKVNYDRAVTGSWIRKNFRVAEKRAGVEHIRGRCAYGVRRVGRDVAEGLSQSAIESFGGWQPGSKIANEVYREPTNKKGRREARGARARLRGEDA